MTTDNAATASNASLPLQLIAIICALFCPIWWAITFSLLIYKITFLPFPPTAFGFEITCTVLLWIVQVGAVSHIKRGNLTEHPATLGLSVVFTVLTIAGAIYYMLLQTYVMMLDLGFSAVVLILNVLALVFTGLTITGISSGQGAQMRGGGLASTLGQGVANDHRQKSE